LDHIFKEDKQWGEEPTFKSQFDEVDDYTQRIILNNNTYFARQDGTTTEDIIDQCIYATHMSTTTKEHEGIISYDTFKLVSQKPLLLLRPLYLKPPSKVLRTSNYYAAALDGCPPTLYKRCLNIPLSTHDFLLVLC
jgi:hypothetical protein